MISVFTDENEEYYNNINPYIDKFQTKCLRRDLYFKNMIDYYRKNKKKKAENQIYKENF